MSCPILFIYSVLVRVWAGEYMDMEAEILTV